MKSLTVHKKQGGIALMECLVSILIFSFGVLGLVGLQASAINFSVDAEDRNRAALFASEVASFMWLQGNVTVPAAQVATWQTAIADPATPMGLPKGVLAIVPTGATTNSADVTITWVPTTDQAGVAVTRTLSTRVILP